MVATQGLYHRSGRVKTQPGIDGAIIPDPGKRQHGAHHHNEEYCQQKDSPNRDTIAFVATQLHSSLPRLQEISPRKGHHCQHQENAQVAATVKLSKQEGSAIQGYPVDNLGFKVEGRKVGKHPVYQPPKNLDQRPQPLLSTRALDKIAHRLRAIACEVKPHTQGKGEEMGCGHRSEKNSDAADNEKDPVLIPESESICSPGQGTLSRVEMLQHEQASRAEAPENSEGDKDQNSQTEEFAKKVGGA